MKATLARVALAGALALSVAPIATAPAHADCAGPVRTVCAAFCSVPNDTVHRICTVL
jgi:hypothetical protein